MKRFRLIREGKVEGLMLAEGIRLVEEALEAGLAVQESLVSPRLLLTGRGRALGSRLAREGGRSRDCADRFLQRAGSLETHQGVLAALEIPTWREEDLFGGEHPFLVVAAGVQDPGNLGALVRTAEAAGASGFLSLRGSAHPFRGKALRGSAGSVFRLPCMAEVEPEALMDLVERRGVELMATDSREGDPLWELPFGEPPQAFLLGSEGKGIPGPLRRRCRRFLRIPLKAPVESLNVSVAAGLVLFEHRRRLSSKGGRGEPSDGASPRGGPEAVPDRDLLGGSLPEGPFSPPGLPGGGRGEGSPPRKGRDPA